MIDEVRVFCLVHGHVNTEILFFESISFWTIDGIKFNLFSHCDLFHVSFSCLMVSLYVLDQVVFTVEIEHAIRLAIIKCKKMLFLSRTGLMIVNLILFSWASALYAQEKQEMQNIVVSIGFGIITLGLIVSGYIQHQCGTDLISILRENGKAEQLKQAAVRIQSGIRVGSQILAAAGVVCIIVMVWGLSSTAKGPFGISIAICVATFILVLPGLILSIVFHGFRSKPTPVQRPSVHYTLTTGHSVTQF
jgi:hypothetical protein